MKKDILVLWSILFFSTFLQAQNIEITSPDIDSFWYVGSTYEITWTSTFTENVKIDLFNEGDFYPIVSSTENDGSYLWTVPENTNPSDLYQMRIQSVDDESVFDLSEYGFQVFLPSVSIIQPNGNEHLLKGNTYEIQWVDNIEENVRIDLWKGGTWAEGGTQIPIITSTESDGSYLWTIPSDLEEGGDYKIRVKSIIDPTNDNLYDYSSNYSLITSATDIGNNIFYAEDILLPYEHVHQINYSEDIDWFFPNFENNRTYRIFNSSTENIDT